MSSNLEFNRISALLSDDSRVAVFDRFDLNELNVSVK